MRLLLATNHLGLGGSESYLLTVAEQLDRLGHEVAVFSPEPDRGADAAEERRIEVIGEGDLARGFDVALVQDGGVSYALADRCPGVPQLFVAHSAKFDLQAPPQLPGLVEAVIVLNDRVERRMRSYALETEVVRLRQPIDTEHFSPRAPLPEVARGALLLSNTPNDDRLAILERACADAGLELRRLGGLSGQTTDVRPAVADAEIVIGYGRSILEAMACGRAAYVYDWRGGDGWVTGESYPTIEADGFAGTARESTRDAAALAADLRKYSAAMGPVNTDLVIANHKASDHAHELVELFARIGRPAQRPAAPLQEMARLVRLEWRARAEVHSLVHENAHLRGLLAESEKKAIEAHEEARRHAEAAARVGSDTARAYESTLSWRLTRPVRSIASLLKRVRRRGAEADPPDYR